jgi:site-specific DNA recombinase
MKTFIYCRKSSEDSDRQVQSIEDQKKAMLELAKQHGLEVVKVFEESRSAKNAGRPKFSEMLDRIKDGETKIILAWKLDRLARNFFDGGNIIGLLQQGVIQKIITSDREYLPTDNVLMMSMEFGMANQFILDLSKNVKRGMRSKWEKGWKTGLAPLGYLNDLTDNTIKKDSERFELVRKMWDLMLTGAYTPEKVSKIASQKWGLTTVKRKRIGGIPIPRTTIYNIFKQTFYYGEFEVSGEIFKGAHEPMITRNEFDRVQRFLGRKGNMRPKTHDFTFTGLMRCGECGCGITAEEKTKFIKSKKEIKGYTYYHCTKRRNHKLPQPCSQKTIEVGKFEEQVSEFLKTIRIAGRFIEWAINHLNKENDQEILNRENIRRNLKRKIDTLTLRMDNLIKLKISAENMDGELLSSEEFKSQKNSLVAEKENTKQETDRLDLRQNDWADKIAKVLEFCRIAIEKFESSTEEKKREILCCLGSNLILKDGILAITPRKAFETVKNNLIEINREPRRLEPRQSAKKIEEKASDEAVNPNWLGRRGSNPRHFG